MYHIVHPALATIGILGSIFAPPWIPIACMVLLSLRNPSVAVVFIGLLMDFLWLPSVAPQLAGWYSIFTFPIFTLAALILLWGLEPLRKELFT